MIKWFVLIILMFGAIGAFALSPIFQIKTIKVAPDQNCINSQQALSDSNSLGKNIFFINQIELLANLSKKYPCIKSLKVKKNYPTTLIFEVEVIRPVAKVENSNIALTEDGQALGFNNQTDLPTLHLGRQPPSPGEKINDELTLFALKVTAAIAKSDFAATSVRIIDENQVALYARSDQVVIFSAKKDARYQVDSLQLVLSKAKIDGTKIAKIDLRFDKPVITYK